MKAAIYEKYGPPEVLQIKEMKKSSWHIRKNWRAHLKHKEEFVQNLQKK